MYGITSSTMYGTMVELYGTTVEKSRWFDNLVVFQ